MTYYSTQKSPVGNGDLWFNEYLSIRPEKCEAVEKTLLPLLLIGEKRKRARRQRNVHATLRIACMVIANALKAAVFAPSRRAYAAA